MTDATNSSVSRRDFVKSSAAVAAVSAVPLVARHAWAAGDETLRVGLVGCGGRGTGAAHNALEASPRVRVAALADLFPDRLESCRSRLAGTGERGVVADEHCFAGFDAYEKVIAADVDLVLLATPPHFRPMQFEAAVRAGKHVFMEKPVAVDPAGIRRVIAAADEADRKGLSVVAGTQRRHEASYLDAMRKVAGGSIGRVVAARCFWNMGGLWMKPPQADWTDMEWQVRNWLYFTWLSGDHIVEQHVHNVDVVNWAIGATPIRANGMGGRQVRTHPDHGNIFDHFAIEYEYPDGVFAMSMCRQTDGADSKVEEAIHGSDGTMTLRPGFALQRGATSWRFEDDNPNPYVVEHRNLVASIAGERTRLNEARRVAESTLTAIMGRMSAYSGKAITWEQAMESTLDLSPPAYEFGPLPVRPVATPGRTPVA